MTHTHAPHTHTPHTHCTHHTYSYIHTNHTLTHIHSIHTPYVPHIHKYTHTHRPHTLSHLEHTLFIIINQSVCSDLLGRTVENFIITGDSLTHSQGCDILTPSIRLVISFYSLLSKSKTNKQQQNWVDMMARTFNSRTQEAEVRGFL